MSKDYGTEGKATLELNDDQIQAIEKATGVRVSEFEIQSVQHRVNQARAGEFGKGASVVVVACW